MIGFLFPLIKEAIKSMLLKKQRTFLALLGIIIGIGSVIAMISVGEIVKYEAIKQFEELGTNIITIRKGIAYDSTGNEVKTKDITIDILPKLKQLKCVDSFSARIDLNSTTVIIGQRIDPRATVMGVTPTFFKINKINLISGRFLTPADKGSDNCIVGNEIYKRVKRSKENIVIIDNHVFKVVGCVGENAAVGIRSFDTAESIFIDIYKASTFFKNPSISQITVRVKKGFTNFQAKKELKRFFDIRKVKVDIHSPDELVAQMEKQLRMFALLLGAIGSISLLVGGIGIMNVLLVSVSERKKEIGIRRAIGAKQRDIQLQFLLESLILTTVGGIIGIILGLLTSWGIAKFSNWDFVFSINSIIAGIAMSFVVGGFFGFYPARQAAKMDPIYALRSE